MKMMMMKMMKMMKMKTNTIRRFKKILFRGMK